MNRDSMIGIKIISTGSYLPKRRVENKVLADYFSVTEEYIEKRTGIQTRYYAEKEETIATMAVEAANRTVATWGEKEKIEAILVATTTTDQLMPGIAFQVQSELQAIGLCDKRCICLDILAGCSSYVNAFDIARNYIAIGKIKNALVIGVDKLSAYLDERDIGTAIILSDGAGATLLGRGNKQEDQYNSNIWCDAQEGAILTCSQQKKIYMEGKAIYKYAVTQPVENVKELLEKNNLKSEEITYFIPHQSNKKIITSIANRLGLKESQVVMNITQVGNTFCASIPIALDEMRRKKVINKDDRLLLLGYGGGLNTGSIVFTIE